MTENSPFLGARPRAGTAPKYIYKPRWVSPTFQSCQNLAIASTMLSSGKCRLNVRKVDFGDEVCFVRSGGSAVLLTIPFRSAPEKVRNAFQSASSMCALFRPCWDVAEAVPRGRALAR
jgi:hypothetical protein